MEPVHEHVESTDVALDAGDGVTAAGVERMDIRAVGWPDEGESEYGVFMEALMGTVLEMAEWLATYPLIRNALRALKKPHLTLHEVVERRKALGWRTGRVEMAFLCRGVVEIEVEESDGAENTSGAVKRLVELLAEVRDLRAII